MKEIELEVSRGTVIMIRSQERIDEEKANIRAFPSEIFDKANMNLNFEKFKVQVWKKMCLVQANFF